MKCLLQVGVLLLSLAAVLTPLIEFFDRWDPSALPMNDTELGIFAVVLILALVLLVSKFVAALDRLKVGGAILPPSTSLTAEAHAGFSIAFGPHCSPPLRI